MKIIYHTPFGQKFIDECILFCAGFFGIQGVTLNVYQLENGLDYDAGTRKLSKSVYELHLNDCATKRDIITRICHEMIHVNQFHTGVLKEVWRKGERLNIWQGKICREKNYNFQPWEVEAFAMQDNLVKEFMIKHLVKKLCEK